MAKMLFFEAHPALGSFCLIVPSPDDEDQGIHLFVPSDRKTLLTPEMIGPDKPIIPGFQGDLREGVQEYIVKVLKLEPGAEVFWGLGIQRTPGKDYLRILFRDYPDKSIGVGDLIRWSMDNHLGSMN